MESSRAVFSLLEMEAQRHQRCDRVLARGSKRECMQSARLFLPGISEMVPCTPLPVSYPLSFGTCPIRRVPHSLSLSSVVLAKVGGRDNFAHQHEG